MLTPSLPLAAPRHRIRELVFAYRPLRDNDGHVVDIATVVFNTPRVAAATLIAGRTLRSDAARISAATGGLGSGAGPRETGCDCPAGAVLTGAFSAGFWSCLRLRAGAATVQAFSTAGIGETTSAAAHS